LRKRTQNPLYYQQKGESSHLENASKPLQNVSNSTDFRDFHRDTIPLMPTKVTVLNNGPIRIEGEFEILDPAGAAFGLAGRTVISLCRCGQSANKPFCDGSHARTGFSDPVTARELPPPKPKL
jgi:CDGSH-type Zn-finger protein